MRSRWLTDFQFAACRSSVVEVYVLHVLLKTWDLYPSSYFRLLVDSGVCSKTAGVPGSKCPARFMTMFGYPGADGGIRCDEVGQVARPDIQTVNCIEQIA